MSEANLRQRMYRNVIACGIIALISIILMLVYGFNANIEDWFDRYCRATDIPAYASIPYVILWFHCLYLYLELPSGTHRTFRNIAPLLLLYMLNVLKNVIVDAIGDQIIIVFYYGMQ